MEPQNTPELNPNPATEPAAAPTNPSPTGPPPDAQATQAQAGEIARTYEQARRELNDAVSKLRSEMEHLDMKRAQDWVGQNPALATFIAVGGGILLGRLLSSAFKPEPPPPLPKRVTHSVLEAADDAKDYAAHFAEAMLAGAAIAGSALASKTAGAGEALVKKAGSLGEKLGSRASGVGETIIDRAEHAVDAMKVDSKDLSKALKKKKHQTTDLAEGIYDAARTVVAAVLVKKATEWVKKMS